MLQVCSNCHMCHNILLGDRALTSANVQRMLQTEDDIVGLEDEILKIPYGKIEDVLPYLTVSEDYEECERQGLELVINYWLLRCPDASWRWLIWQLDKQQFHELAKPIHPYAEQLTGTKP